MRASAVQRVPASAEGAIVPSISPAPRPERAEAALSGRGGEVAAASAGEQDSAGQDLRGRRAQLWSAAKLSSLEGGPAPVACRDRRGRGERWDWVGIGSNKGPRKKDVGFAGVL